MRGAPPRGQVRELQRARILAAMSEVCCERGRSGATVAQVIARAGVSRPTFYEQFQDLDDCFLAVFDEAIERATLAVTAAFTGQPTWAKRVRAGLLALLSFLDEHPDLARICVVEALAGSPATLRRRGELAATLATVVDQGRAQGRGDPPPLAAEGIVGGVLAIIHGRLVKSGRGGLRELLGPLMSIVVLPYMGKAAAQRELARPAPEPASSPRSQRPPRGGVQNPGLRLTYRTLRVLTAISEDSGASNRAVARAAGILDDGQVSKLLARLAGLALIENVGAGQLRGEPNAWRLTAGGRDLLRVVARSPLLSGRLA